MLSLQFSSPVQPLDTVTVKGGSSGRLVFRDGLGRVYHETPAADPTTVVVGGALGMHSVTLLDAEGRQQGFESFPVATQTSIEDEGGRFGRLLNLLHDTMFNDFHSGYKKGLRIDGKWYRYYVSWIRDHVHVLKGMKYYDLDTGGMKSGIELFADSQRDDGMIWDKCKDMLHSELQNYRDVEFAVGDFIRPIPGHPTRRWQRIPVENDVEYLWIEGLYSTWKATGDTDWMSRYLDGALAAVHYATSDEYRWSERYGLLKRGYTIDTWDFQHADDVARSGSPMRVYPDKTVFGVMFGDNTGMIASCRYLKEMLATVGRGEDAKRMSDLADTLEERVNRLCWNGSFYTHHVSEQPEVKRDCGGTDESAQVVQSNAYSLNRGIGREKARAIIRTYQRIREEMPATSAGEFYACYPPFEKGFQQAKWDYMNGGVTTICAGELARGAFRHGFESYGVNVLERLLGWVERLNGHLHCTLKGALPELPDAHYTPLDLTCVANVNYRDEAGAPVRGWIREGANDMRHLPTGQQTFASVRFEVINPSENEGRACLALGQREGLLEAASVAVGRKAQSVFFLQASNGQADLLGSIRFHYADGSHATQYIRDGQQIASFFMPAPNHAVLGGNRGKQRPKNLRLAWQGPNGQFENVGMFVYGWTNPEPDKVIERIEFKAAEGVGQWFVGAISLNDGPVVFEEGPVSYGIPDGWGAAALVYALIEGLAGIVDDGLAYDRVRLSPRWAAAGVDAVTATACYPNSGGYCRYRYRLSGGDLRIDLAGNGRETALEILLPEDLDAKTVLVDGEEVEWRMDTVESSPYLKVTLEGISAHTVVVRS